MQSYLIFFGASSGFVIILQFVLCAIYLHFVSQGEAYKSTTMSGIAADPKHTNKVRFFCWSVSLLTFPYLYALMIVFDTGVFSLTNLFGVIASVSLFMVALTINAPRRVAHQVYSYIFYIILSVMPLSLALNFRSIEKLAIYGNLVLLLFSLGAATLFIQIVVRRGKANGLSEVVVMGFNSFWVILYSVLALLQ